MHSTFVSSRLLRTLRCMLVNCVLLSLALVSAPIVSQTDSEEDLSVELKTLIPTLVASPGICELKTGQTQCEMLTSLIWEVPRAGHFCLQEEDGTVLQCWQNQWSGTFQFRFQSGSNRTFLLVRGSGKAVGTIAANATIAVTGTLEQRLRAQRRRSLWRLF